LRSAARGWNEIAAAAVGLKLGAMQYDFDVPDAEYQGGAPLLLLDWFCKPGAVQNSRNALSFATRARSDQIEP